MTKTVCNFSTVVAFMMSLQKIKLVVAVIVFAYIIVFFHSDLFDCINKINK